MEALSGVTEIDSSVGATSVTFKVAEPLIPSRAAMIVLVPGATPVANPSVSIVATEVSELVQFTSVVISVVLSSVYVPIAVNCRVSSTPIVTLSGVTEIDSRIGTTTVKLVEPLIPSRVAVIVVVPTATGVASPNVSMLATAVSELVQFTSVVISVVLSSVYVPIAVNCRVSSTPTVALSGVTEMDSRIGIIAVKLVEPLMPSRVAVIVVVPTATGVASPNVSMPATVGSELSQVTSPVISAVLPSEYVPVAEYCWVLSIPNEAFSGVTEIDSRTVGTIIVRSAEPSISSRVAAMVAAPSATPVASPNVSMLATVESELVHVQSPVILAVLPSE
jgi:hypothetical protein